MVVTALYHMQPQLPWSSSDQEDSRFKKILRHVLAALLAFGILIPLLPLPEIEREKLEELPPQLAKIIIEKKKLPPAPVVKPRTKPKPLEQVKSPEKPKPVVKPKPETVQKARAKAARSGLLALQSDLADMRQNLNVVTVATQPLRKGTSEAVQSQRKVITQQAGSNSGGINTGNLSRDTAGGQLATRETTRVKAPLVVDGVKPVIEEVTENGSSTFPRRSEESIRAVLDQNKGAIYAIYNRALRKDPSLQGKVTVQVVIEASGLVSGCKLLDSELNNAQLERKLIARIKMVNFGAQDVDQTVFNYTFDFLPY